MVNQPLHDFQLAKNLLVTTLLLQDEFLWHCFNGVKSAGIFFARKVNFFSKTSPSNDFDLVKVFHRASFLVLLYPLFVLWLFGKNCEQLNPVFEYLVNFFVWQGQPQIHAFILVFCPYRADDFLFKLKQFSWLRLWLLQQTTGMQMDEVLLFVSRWPRPWFFIYFVRNRLYLVDRILDLFKVAFINKLINVFIILCSNNFEEVIAG